jgi:hypothetical protein
MTKNDERSCNEIEDYSSDHEKIPNAGGRNLAYRRSYLLLHAFLNQNLAI